MDKKELVHNSELLLSHLVLEKASEDNDFLEHVKSLGDDVEVKVSIGGYEVTCESFQDYFMAIWKRSNVSENERVKALLGKKLRDLIDKIEDVETFFEQTSTDLVDRLEW
jgi:hypothetical protein